MLYFIFESSYQHRTIFFYFQNSYLNPAITLEQAKTSEQSLISTHTVKTNKSVEAISEIHHRVYYTQKQMDYLPSFLLIPQQNNSSCQYSANNTNQPQRVMMLMFYSWEWQHEGHCILLWFVHIISENKMIKGQTQVDQSSSTFKKGMTLDEYLSEMKDVRQEKQTEDDHLEEDLYETSRRVKQSLSKKLITYEIRESDEDNYDQSNQERVFDNQQNNMSTQIAFYEHQKSNKNIMHKLKEPDPRNALENSRGFRVRRQSNSPFNQIKKETSLSPGKSFSRTLHTHEWKMQKEPAKNLLPSSTLYGKFLKGLKDKQTQRPRENSKEKYFKKKNNQEIQYVIKYERDKNSKYARSQYQEILQMRVEGITDRLVDRKHLHGKSIK